jgi:hypothetical protein
MNPNTSVSIENNAFLINGEPTYRNRHWNGHSIEGLLLNSRMVQGIFDDMNPETRADFAYPDSGEWDPERNTREFIEAMPLWRKHGLLAFTINLQGGSPVGYGNHGWVNSAFTPEGELDSRYMDRMAKILKRADELGMVVILGYYYFGQDQHLKDEAAVLRGLDNATLWVLKSGYKNIIIEVNNESDIAYTHEILKHPRVHELIQRIKAFVPAGEVLSVGTSFSGGQIPTDEVISCSDFILLHGNGVSDPARIAEMVEIVRAKGVYRNQPILFNEDDHFDFENESSNMVAAIKSRASWGYFDYRMKDEGFACGYQSVPVDWGINSDRKRRFFNKVCEITGA